MTEKSRSKNWLKNKNLLRFSAALALGAVALTGCSKANGEAVPTPSPTEQTQTSPTPEVTPEVSPTPEVSATPEVSKIDLANSDIYNNMSKADKKSVDTFMKLDLKEFSNLHEEEQNLVSTVLMDANKQMYTDSIKDLEVDQWGPLGDYKESKNSTNTVDLAKLSFDAAIYTPADTIRSDAPRDKDGIYATNFTQDGWFYTEETPYMQTNMALTIANQLAASGIPENLDAAKKIIVGSIYTDRDHYNSGRMFTAETEQLANLDALAASGEAVDPVQYWADTDLYGRMLDKMPHSEILVFGDGTGSGIGPNELGETAAVYQAGAEIKLTNGETAQGWMKADAYTSTDPINDSGAMLSQPGGESADGGTTHGFEINGTDY